MLDTFSCIKYNTSRAFLLLRSYKLLMANTDLKLLGGWFNPFVLRVRIALNIKSLEYENVEETLNPKSQLLLQSNPVHKKIPVLLHGDKPSVNLESLSNTYTRFGTLVPPSYQQMLTIEPWLVSGLPTSMTSVVRAEEEEGRKPYLEGVEDALVTMEGELQKHCREGKGFYGGGEIGLVDITLGSSMCWLSVIETMSGRKILVEAKHPGLVKWAERFLSDPNVKGLIPETEKLREFAKALKMKWKAAASAK